MSSIGSHRACALEIFQQFGLAPFRDILGAEVFREAAHNGRCAPKRKRPLVPEVVAWLMMYVGLQTTSMTQGLCRAWGLLGVACPWLRQRCITEEAFCQARKQLTIGFWRNVSEHLGRRFEATFDPALLWKHRFRLLAVDGSDINLPNAPNIARCFGRARNGAAQGRRPQGKLVALCSVLTGFCFDFKLISKSFTEHHALRHLMRRLRRDDLLLMDRGFFSLRSRLAHPVVRRAFPDAVFRSAGRLRQALARAR